MMVLRQPMNLTPLEHHHNVSSNSGSLKLDGNSISLPSLMQEVGHHHHHHSLSQQSSLEQSNLILGSSSNSSTIGNSNKALFEAIEFQEKYSTVSIAPSSSTSTLKMAEKTSRTNLYLKGLPDDFTDDRLWDLVPDKSQVKSVKAATEDDTKCRGYGFIDFLTCEAAQIALRHIQTNFPLFTIKFAKENEKDKTNLYVTNIPKSWTTKDSDKLKEVFEKFGQIQSAFVMVERSSNKSLGIGFVRFANEDDALNTIDSLKNSPLILPTCSHPVEAKFADKHNPETRRRKHQVMTTSSLGLNAAMLGGAGPLLGNFAFTPSSLSAFPSIPQAHGTHPSLAALGINPMTSTNSNHGFHGNNSSSLLQATMNLGTASPTTPSVSNENGNNLLNSLGVQSTSAQTHSTPQPSPFPTSAEQLSLIASGFPVQNLYSLYGNQFYRPTSGGSQHPANATNQNAITSAILATLNNNASFTNQNNPYSTLVAYQALMNGATTTSNMMSVNNSTSSIYNGPSQTATGQQSQQQHGSSRTNLYHPTNNSDVNNGNLLGTNSDANMIQFQ